MGKLESKCDQDTWCEIPNNQKERTDDLVDV